MISGKLGKSGNLKEKILKFFKIFQFQFKKNTISIKLNNLCSNQSKFYSISQIFLNVKFK